MKNIIRATTIALTVLFFPLILCSRAEVVYAQPNPREDLTVTDYSWKSHGVGRIATLEKITVANLSSTDYGNIRIRVDLLGRNGKFLGPLRGTLSQKLPAGSRETFYDLDLGLMSLNLEDSEVIVTGADVLKSSSSVSAESIIFIKNWEFEGGNFATEGFITEITLENTGETHFKNIKVLLTEKDGGSGPGSVHQSSVTIHDILPAGEEKTFTGINVGFSSPNAIERSIAISGAEPMTTKELNYTLSGGGSLGERIKKKSSSVSILRKKNEEQESEPASQQMTSTDKFENSYNDTTENISSLDELKVDKNTDISERQYKESPEVFPKHDIVIREFKWGSGVPGSTATLSKLVIENISDITYEKIEFEIEFFKSGNTPFGSNRFKIKQVLSPKQVMWLKNVQVGFINKLPDPNHIKLRVVKAKAIM
ncbi:MAG: hypothetical protein OXF23_04650 [Candidatus Dadabacteria bacterium]|nr:hypothetical protein [Candidatus Dadabacteria bacterium]